MFTFGLSAEQYSRCVRIDTEIGVTNANWRKRITPPFRNGKSTTLRRIQRCRRLGDRPAGRSGERPNVALVLQTQRKRGKRTGFPATGATRTMAGRCERTSATTSTRSGGRRATTNSPPSMCRSASKSKRSTTSATANGSVSTQGEPKWDGEAGQLELYYDEMSDQFGAIQPVTVEDSRPNSPPASEEAAPDVGQTASLRAVRPPERNYCTRDATCSIASAKLHTGDCRVPIEAPRRTVFEQSDTSAVPASNTAARPRTGRSRPQPDGASSCRRGFDGVRRRSQRRSRQTLVGRSGREDAISGRSARSSTVWRTPPPSSVSRSK